MPGAVLPAGAAAHDRKPNIRFLRRSHRRRHHADHGVNLVMKTKGAPENGRIFLKNALPKPVANDRQRWPAYLVFLVGKSAAQFRRQTDHLKKICRDERSADAFGPATGNTAEI